ncbi:copper amine oxidase N-terminal domain-containing protein [Anaerophilus nitritogenes]|uniref:copper amine oxidase N-terminal domain-containing protein n=1 Tax=Anaerophilus nitritogenes TaxID=2498136 RepID=UPI00101C98E1|nr:copper amine oxidase N-terminal domain-containing protein [Anaerophilus nitritogenes]
MMKKKLSLALALSLMVSLVPMSAFAASVNSVDKEAKVKDDYEFTLKDAPVLNVENDKGHWSDSERITLVLENADWSDPDGGNSEFNQKLEDAIEITNDYETVAGKVYASVSKNSDKRIEVTVKTKDGKKISKDTVVKIPMWADMDGEVGKVKLESNSGRLTEGTYIFARGNSGDTRVFIDDTVTFSTTKKIETVTIEESVVNSIDVDKMGNRYIKYKFDKNFNVIVDENTKLTGDLFKKTIVLGDKNGKLSQEAIDAGVELKDEELKIYVHGGRSGKDTKGFALNPNRTEIEKIQLIGLKVKPANNAKEGKVNLNVSSDISEIESSNLEIGEYANYKVKVEADGDAKEIFSGRYESNAKDLKFKELDNTGLDITSDEAHELQKLIIDEKAEDSWTNNKSVLVKFPSWVKIMGVDRAGKTHSKMINMSVDQNEYEFEIDKSVEGKKKVELTFYVSVEGGKEGDIEAEVTGRGLEGTQKVVLGKAINPIKVEAEVSKIRTGIRDQEIGKITITEIKAGAIEEDKDIVIELDKDMDWDDEPTVKVVKGNLEIEEDDIKVKDNILTIPVDDESTEASTIEITNSRVRVDRSVAQGKIEVEVKGSAIMGNGYDKDIHESADVKKKDLLDDYGFFNNDYFAKVEVANVITPADSNVKNAAEVKFVIGSTEYKIGEEVKQADVAPYIKDGRTMLPVSFVAEAMGADNVLWNDATRTVTVMKGSQMAQMTIGSNMLTVNGMNIPMDTVAEIKDGRTMLPISYIATALGATTEWDAATQTVIIK